MAEMSAEDWIARADAVCARWKVAPIEIHRDVCGKWQGRPDRHLGAVLNGTASTWNDFDTLDELAESVATIFEAHETYLCRLKAWRTLTALAETDPTGMDNVDAWVSDIRDTAASMAQELQAWCATYEAERAPKPTPTLPPMVTSGTTITDTSTYEPTINGATG